MSSETKWLVLDTNQVGSDADAFQNHFKANVIGQPNAEKVALMAFEAANNPLRDMNKPIGVYVLIGPSRSGKTYTGKVTAKFIHGEEDAVTEIEGGDFQQEHQVLELKGAPPSYKGHRDPEETAKLKETAVDPTSIISNHNLKRARLGSRSKINIVIINEFEKAHEDFYKFWMGVFDHGKARLGNGEIVDFTNTIFFLTMNLAMDELERMASPMGFRAEEKKITANDVQNVVKHAMVKRFPKEFRNRIDATVIFKPHSTEDLLQIVDKEMRMVDERIASQLPRGKAFTLVVLPPAKQFLLDQALKTQGDVAGLKRVLERELVNRLGRELSKKTIGSGDLVQVDVSEDGSQLVFKSGSKAGDLAPADQLTTSGGTQEGLSFQRRLFRAQQMVRRREVPVGLFNMSLIFADEEEMYEEFAGLQHDLVNVFEIKIVSAFVHKVEPFMGVLGIVTSKEMIDLLREKYPEAQLERHSEKNRAS